MSGEIQRIIVSSSSGSGRSCYHTDPECPSVKQMKNPQTWNHRGNLTDLPECQICSGEFDGNPWASTNTCTCGAQLVDGECAFCTRFEEVLGE